MNEEGYVRIASEQMYSEFQRILLGNGFSEERASACAQVFLVNSLEGVYSHGVNRFPRFVKGVNEGFIRPGASPELVHSSGSVEQWNGNLGPGMLNAGFATARAMELAAINTIGMVGLANTNHWMRAGTYGWQAALKGFILICWTNTCPNMPAWGAKDPRLGNNPLVFAVPWKDTAIVLDFAMSQFSYGKIESYRDMGKKLPYYGGFNRQGELTDIPSEILNSWRILPTGYWKGSSLSLMLDILSVVLSGGLSTHEVKSCVSENALSQVFIAIDPRKLKNYPSIDSSINAIINDLKRSIPSDEKSVVRYPGENIASIRETNLAEGIPVKNEIWEKILNL
jgi:3-dehydro-L-gulonate 2-dehydrogenase